jgi:hypothetical protein
VEAHGPVFVTTQWSVVLAASSSDTTKALAAQEKLCRAYWYPLYAYVRRRGHRAGLHENELRLQPGGLVLAHSHHRFDSMSMIRFLVALAIVCLAFQLSVQGQTNQEAMTPELFRKIVATPGDSVPLAPQLAAAPFWTNAVVSNEMTYASGKIFTEEMTQTARTVRSKYVVFTVQSKYYNQPMSAILAYDEKASTLKVYGLYGNSHGGDIVTEGAIVYDYAKKTYTSTSSYGDGFKEITTGSYTDTEDVAKTVVYKDGVSSMTREVVTRPVPAGAK